MKLEWLGKYRDFFENWFYYANTYGQIYSIQGFHDTTVPCSLAELQILEYILENEEKNQKMAEIAMRLGISPATFSKNVKKMVQKNLLEKYKSTINKKEIIVKSTSLGEKVYKEYVDGLLNKRFRETFKILDQIPSMYIDEFSQIFKLNADSMVKQMKKMQEEKNPKDSSNSSVIELIKVEN